MFMYTVYILECADGTLYTGVTTDLERRVKEHAEGKGAKYTRTHGVRMIRYSETGLTQSMALRREAEIKKWTRDMKEKFLHSSTN